MVLGEDGIVQKRMADLLVAVESAGGDTPSPIETVRCERIPKPGFRLFTGMEPFRSFKLTSSLPVEAFRMQKICANERRHNKGNQWARFTKI